MAAVEEARKSAEGPFRALAPLFLIAIERQRGQLLNIHAAVEVLTPVLGMSFTEHAFEAFIPSMVAMNWLVEELVRGQALYRISFSVPPFDEQSATESSITKLNRLYEVFKEFLDRSAPLLSITIDSSEFQWALFRWATSLDGSDKQAILREATRLTAGERPSVRQNYLDENQRFSRVEKTLSIEFAGFVKWLVRHRRVELADIASLTELGLALEFLDELREPTFGANEQIKTNLVLDAPVLLDLLGLSGQARQESIERCLKTLRSRGARVLTLTHCLEELAEIVTSVLRRPASQRFGLTGDALKSDPDLIERARQIAKQPDRAAKASAVEVLNFDPTAPLYEKFFPEPLVDRFRNSATWHDESKTEQRDRDALSVAFVMRRRQGQVHSDVLETPFVLVTRNSTFTRYADVFVKSNLSVANFGFGPTVETKTLAAIVWIRFGSSESARLPEIQLIAACDRLLASNRELLRKAEQKVAALAGEQTATALLSSQQAVLDLVIAAAGSPDVIDVSSGEEIIRALTAAAEEKGKLKERKTTERVKARMTETIATREEELQQLKAETSKLSELHELAQVEIRQQQALVKRYEREWNERIAALSNRLAQRSESISGGFVTIVWIACALVGFFGQLFIWNGLTWWHSTGQGFLTGLAVIICAAVALVFCLRWVVPGQLDVAGTLQRHFYRLILLWSVSRIEPKEDRIAVSDHIQSN